VFLHVDLCLFFYLFILFFCVHASFSVSLFVFLFLLFILSLFLPFFYFYLIFCVFLTVSFSVFMFNLFLCLSFSICIFFFFLCLSFSVFLYLYTCHSFYLIWRYLQQPFSIERPTHSFLSISPFSTSFSMFKMYPTKFKSRKSLHSTLYMLVHQQREKSCYRSRSKS
jgi:hypothetical protein